MIMTSMNKTIKTLAKMLVITRTAAHPVTAHHHHHQLINIFLQLVITTINQQQGLMIVQIKDQLVRAKLQNLLTILIMKSLQLPRVNIILCFILLVHPQYLFM